jgi:hypothetical protein
MLLERVEPFVPEDLKVLDPISKFFEWPGIQMVYSASSVPPF